MKNGIMFNVEDIIPLYYEDKSGQYKALGKISEFELDISDIVEPTEVYGQFVKKIKFNQEYSFSVEISNVDKEALMKAFIEPYIQYCFERDLMYSYIKSYMRKIMKEKGMSDREIVIEEVYKKHCWKYSPRI